MSAEKTIKIQAKKSLTGNWSLIICAAMFFAAVLIAIYASASAVYMMIYNAVTVFGEYSIGADALIEAISTVFMILCAAAVSPLVNGFFRILFKTSSDGKAEFNEFFFFFNGAKRYFKTLAVNIILTFLFILLGYAFDAYGWVCMATGQSLWDGTESAAMTVLLAAALLLSVMIKISVYFLFVHYPLIAYSSSENMSIKKSVFGFNGFSFANYGRTVKLFVSFIGWILLCFFVVPVFYVLPYFAMSAVTSAKWLFLLNEDRSLLC